MCGIAGYISLNQSLLPNQLETATALMQHRGPDADGFYYAQQNQVGLAHRRLSIIDLSTAANQPMHSADGRYTIVFNGEVYNFQSLKTLLPDGGNYLSTQGDTEVILELFAQQGPACFRQLNGMFALAIYDHQQQVLTLARDHMGIKPLFYYQDEQNIIFASELKVIRQMMSKRLQINRTAIPAFLHLGFIPEPATIYQQVFKFPSAHYVQIATSQPRLPMLSQQQQCFWQLAQQIAPQTLSDEAIALPQLKALLQQSVQQQLVSDVPIGTFLSGGIDSSIVTALAAEATGNQRIQTFSMGIDDGRYNESEYAAKVAKHLGTIHHEFKVTEQEVVDLIDQLLPAYDEPFADTSAFPTMMVSRLARQHVTVTLSGDGGDELFQGYGMYRWAQRLNHPATQLFRKSIYAASTLLSSRLQRAGKLFNYPTVTHQRSHIFSQEQYHFSEQELQELLIQPGFNFAAINQLPATARTLNAREEQALWDIGHYLKDDLLVKVDRASMQYSLESRVPLLDYQLVEWAANLDTSLKVNNHITKYLLKEVLYQYVPKAIFDRPKWGFSIPLVKWLKNDLRELMELYTSPAVIQKHGIVNEAFVQRIKQQYLRGTDYLYNRLWLVVVLHWWLEKNEQN